MALISVIVLDRPQSRNLATLGLMPAWHRAYMNACRWSSIHQFYCQAPVPDLCSLSRRLQQAVTYSLHISFTMMHRLKTKCRCKPIAAVDTDVASAHDYHHADRSLSGRCAIPHHTAVVGSWRLKASVRQLCKQAERLKGQLCHHMAAVPTVTPHHRSQPIMSAWHEELG